MEDRTEGGMLTVGKMIGKSREMADMMEQRSLDILCVQETRWKGVKARCIGVGYILWCYGNANKKHGVGIVLRKDFIDRVVEAQRISDRVMCVRLELDGVMMNIVSAYTPRSVWWRGEGGILDGHGRIGREDPEE